MKKIVSIVLLVCMLLSLSATATATSLNAGGATKTDLVGNIVATQVVVSVPATVPFNLDPTVTASSPTAQVTAATVDFENQSLVPIYVKITAVATDNSSTGVVLTNNESDLTNAKTVMLAFKEQNVVRDFSTASDWLTTSISDSDNYYLTAASDAGKIDAKDKLTIEVCGRTETGWAAGNSFTVTPTFVVGTTMF